MMRIGPECGGFAGCGRQNEQETESRWWSMEKQWKPSDSCRCPLAVDLVAGPPVTYVTHAHLRNGKTLDLARHRPALSVERRNWNNGENSANEFHRVSMSPKPVDWILKPANWLLINWTPKEGHLGEVRRVFLAVN